MHGIHFYVNNFHLNENILPDLAGLESSKRTVHFLEGQSRHSWEPGLWPDLCVCVESTLTSSVRVGFLQPSSPGLGDGGSASCGSEQQGADSCQLAGVSSQR